MKIALIIFATFFIFALGYFVGGSKESYGSCKGKNTFVSSLFSRKSDQDLKVYTTATCPYCTSAKSLLSNHNIDYSEIDISDDHQLKAEMIEKSKGRRTVPQVFVGDIHIGGFDDLQTIVETFKPCTTENN